MRRGKQLMNRDTAMQAEHSSAREASTGEIQLTAGPFSGIDIRHVCVAVAASSLVAGILLIFYPGFSLQPLVGLWLFAFCPGFPFVRWLRVSDPVAEVGLTVVVSLCVTSIVAGLLLYSGLWSLTVGIVAIAAIAVAGATLQIVSAKR
jgi:hypothetical protein